MPNVLGLPALTLAPLSLDSLPFRSQNALNAWAQGECCDAAALPSGAKVSISPQRSFSIVQWPASAPRPPLPVHRGLFNIAGGDWANFSQLRFAPALLTSVDECEPSVECSTSFDVRLLLTLFWVENLVSYFAFFLPLDSGWSIRGRRLD